MPQKNNTTNLRALLRVGAEFHFANGAAAATAAATFAVGGFTPFGNIVEITPQIDTQKVEHVSANRGAPRKDREDITRSQIQFKIKTDEFNKLVQKIMLGGSDGTNFSQAIQSAASADVLAFGTTAAVIGNWYDITVLGARIRNISALTIASKVEGTDFVVDQLTGRIMFLTAQTANLTPVVTAPAITAGSTAAFYGIKPGTTVKLNGVGRLFLFDQDDQNTVFADYQDFTCQITLDSASAFSATSFADLTFTVLVTDTVGNWQSRTSTNNVSVA